MRIYATIKRLAKISDEDKFILIPETPLMIPGRDEPVTLTTDYSRLSKVANGQTAEQLDGRRVELDVEFSIRFETVAVSPSPGESRPSDNWT
jgi:hypothetical protein